jgi:hypothetical protein
MSHEDAKTICNMCGNSLLTSNHEGAFHGGLVNAKVSGGYDSEYLSDMSSYTFSFCEKCLASILLKCKIEPYISEYGFGEGFGDDCQDILFDTNPYGSFKKEQEYMKYKRWYNEGYPNKNSDVYQHFLKNKCTFKYKCKNKAKYLVTYKNGSEPFSRAVIYHTCCKRHSKDAKEHNIMIPYMSEVNQFKMILLK